MIEKAGVRRIKFHGLRHTSATLALQSGASGENRSEEARAQAAESDQALAGEDLQNASW